MVNVAAGFRTWLKSATNMKLSSDAAVTRVTHEGLTNYDTLKDFDKDSILHLPKVCKETIAAIPEDLANNINAEPEVSGANVNSISVQRLIVASNAARYYDSIQRTMDSANMHYNNVLVHFKVEWTAYESL